MPGGHFWNGNSGSKNEKKTSFIRCERPMRAASGAPAFDLGWLRHIALFLRCWWGQNQYKQKENMLSSTVWYQQQDVNTAGVCVRPVASFFSAPLWRTVFLPHTHRATAGPNASSSRTKKSRTLPDRQYCEPSSVAQKAEGPPKTSNQAQTGRKDGRKGGRERWRRQQFHPSPTTIQHSFIVRLASSYSIH